MNKVRLTWFRRLQIAYYARKHGLNPYELTVIYRALALYINKKNNE